MKPNNFIFNPHITAIQVSYILMHSFKERFMSPIVARQLILKPPIMSSEHAFPDLHPDLHEEAYSCLLLVVRFSSHGYGRQNRWSPNMRSRDLRKNAIKVSLYQTVGQGHLCLTCLRHCIVLTVNTCSMHGNLHYHIQSPMVPWRPATLAYSRARACCACSRCGTGGLYFFFIFFICFPFLMSCLLGNS